METQTNTQRKPENRFTFFRVFREVFCVGAILVLCLIAPSVLGRFVGHGWGLLAAIADIFGWFYLNHKYCGKNRLVLSTRIIWLLLLASLIVIATFEFTHLSH